MEIYSDNFINIVFTEDNNILTSTWFTKTEIATDDDFKEWNFKLVETVKEFQPKTMLADTRNYFFTITPELQTWSIENIFNPFYNAGLRKIALLVSPELFAQVSLEQFIDENKKDALQTQYFDNLKNAQNWLLS